MIISDYGKYTQIYLKNAGSIEVSGWIDLQIGSPYFLPDNPTEYTIKGYAHRKHGEIIRKRGDTTSLGWVVNEVIGMSIVNPRGFATGRKTT